MVLELMQLDKSFVTHFVLMQWGMTSEEKWIQDMMEIEAKLYTEDLSEEDATEAIFEVRASMSTHSTGSCVGSAFIDVCFQTLIISFAVPLLKLRP